MANRYVHSTLFKALRRNEEAKFDVSIACKISKLYRLTLSLGGIKQGFQYRKGFEYLVKGYLEEHTMDHERLLGMLQAKKVPREGELRRLHSE